MKRLLVVSDNFGNYSNTFIYQDIKELSKLYQVEYLSIQRFNEEQFQLCPVHIAPFKRNRFWNWLYFQLEKKDISINHKNWAYKKFVSNYLNSYRPDIIHCHFGYEALRFLQNVNLEALTKTKIVITFHGYDASAYLKKKSYIKEIKSLANHQNIEFISVSQFIQNEVNNTIPEVKNKNHLVFNGVDLNFFKPVNHENNHDLITFFNSSRFVRRKGHTEMILAFNEFIKSFPLISCKLILAGDGPTYDEMLKLSKKLHLEDQIIFPGWTDQYQIKKYLDQCDIYVQHSLTIDNTTEGLPVAILEAMAMGKPIVSTYHSGIPEIVENGVNGYLAEEKDIEEFSKSMIKAIELIPTAKTINREKIENKFSVQQHVKTLINIYERPE